VRVRSALWPIQADPDQSLGGFGYETWGEGNLIFSPAPNHDRTF